MRERERKRKRERERESERAINHKLGGNYNLSIESNARGRKLNSEHQIEI